MRDHHVDLRSAGALICAAACWGVATVITKAVLSTIPPLTLLTIQLTVSTVLLWGLMLGIRSKLPQSKALLSVGLLGLLNPGISYTLSLLGLTKVSSV